MNGLATIRDIGAGVTEFLVKLVDHCEMSCLMCGQSSQSDRRARLSLSDLEKAFATVRLHGKRIYIWGGEPLLYPALLAVVNFFKRKGALVAVNTNGQRLAKYLQSLAAIHLDRLILSLDAAEAATHDMIRGTAGSFELVLGHIRALKQFRSRRPKPLVRVNCVVLPENYRQLLDLVELCRQEEVYKVHLQLPMYVTQASMHEYADLLKSELSITVRNYSGFQREYSGIDFEHLHRIMQVVAGRYRSFARFYPHSSLSINQLEAYFTGNTPIRPFTCDMSSTKLAVDSSGDFVTCPDFPDISYGTLVDGVVRPERLHWLNSRLEAGLLLPTCARCCHLVPLI